LVCIRPPYNIDARLTCPPPALPAAHPIAIKVKNVNSSLLRELSDSVLSFLLREDTSPGKLANGVYYLESTLGGKIKT
jgi:hypothetical protein